MIHAYFVVVGVLAAWLAGRVLRGHGFGLPANIVVGVVGAFAGGYLFREAGAEIGAGPTGDLLVAFFGAMLLLIAVRLVAGRRERHRTGP